MSNARQPQNRPATSTWPRTDGNPASPSPPPSRSAIGYGIVSLCLAAASFVSAPFLLLLPVAGFIPAALAAAGVVFAGIGLRRSDRRPGLAVAGLIVSVVLFGLTLSTATLWARLVVVPAIRDYSELHEVTARAKRLIEGSVR